MKHRSHLSARERAARSRLAKLVHDEPFVQGSLVTMKNRCGKPGCKCNRGERHICLCLSVRDEGKRRMIHVPKDLEEAAKTWVDNYMELKSLMDELSQSCIDRLKQAKTDKGRSQRQRSKRR